MEPALAEGTISMEMSHIKSKRNQNAPAWVPGATVIICQQQKYSSLFPSFQHPKSEYLGSAGIAKPLLCRPVFIHHFSLSLFAIYLLFFLLPINLFI